MHCVRFEMRLNELLDERASPETDRKLIDHAENCPDCAQLLAGHELLRSGREWFEPTIGADFSVRVAAAIADHDKRSWRGHWVGSIAAIAAGIIVAVGISHFRNSTSTDSERGGAGVIPRESGMVKFDSRLTAPDYQGLLARTSEWSQRFGEQRPQWVDEMADGLKPVADSMSAALHALRRTLPRGEAPVRSSQFEPASLKIAEVA